MTLESEWIEMKLLKVVSDIRTLGKNFATVNPTKLL